MKIVAAIPNYNDSDYLDNLLKQLFSQNFYKVYILDDGSTDGSQDIYKKYEHHENLIVIKGNRKGLIGNKNRMLNQDCGDVIFFLDADMRLETNDIPEVITEYFVKYPDMGCLGAQVFDSAGRPIIYSYYSTHPISVNALRSLLHGSTKEDYSAQIQKVGWTLEGACAVKSSVFKDLNGFDEEFKLYHEGHDLYKRARYLGFETYLTTDVIVRHLRPLTLSVTKVSQHYKFLRATTRFYWKHYLKRTKQAKH